MDDEKIGSIPLISDQIKAQPPGGPTHDPIYKRSDDFNFTDILSFVDGPPHAAYDALRTNSPVAWQDMEHERGFWMLTRHDDVRHVSRHTDMFSSQRGGILQVIGSPEQGIPRLTKSSLNSMIVMDGDWHTQMRERHQAHFTPEAVQKVAKKIEAKSRDLIEAFPKSGNCNLVEHLSQELPLFTLSEILGIDEADRPKLVQWMHYLEMASYLIALQNTQAGEIPAWAPKVEPDFFEKLIANVQEMFDYGQYQLKKRRDSADSDGTDLLATIAWSNLEESLLADEYLDGSWLLIVFAGNDTTRNTLSGTMKLLSDFPRNAKSLWRIARCSMAWSKRQCAMYRPCSTCRGRLPKIPKSGGKRSPRVKRW